MFTGLVRAVGAVVSLDNARLAVASELRTGLGDSVAVDGVCLTVVGTDDGTLAFDVVPETLARTALGALRPGARVNLEPALRAGDPLGGHYVQGHVDAVARVRSVEAEGDGRRAWFDLAPALLRYVVSKGSVAVAGVSLTVADVDERGFAVALVPHTLAHTTLASLQPEDAVNVETDVLAKYVEKLVAR
ncbi:MAG TPA: riboflavin synthase [Gaiellaceae bacterium]|nr:riboflavin synthase [Gaiellaceae bacterium]